MDHFTKDSNLIGRYAKELKLPTVKESLEDLLSDAAEQHWAHLHFLCILLQREVEQRYENRKLIRIRKASFPQMKCLRDS